MYIVTRAISLITSVICLMIVIAGICTQPAMSLFFGNIPSSLAWILTFTASYYAYEVEQIPLWYFIIYVVICIVCGLIGTPLSYITKFLSNLLSKLHPKQKKNMLLQTTALPVKSEDAKDSWKDNFIKILDMIQDSVLGPVITIFVILPIAILDTIVGSIIYNGETKEERKIWGRVFRKESKFYEYNEVYENFDNDYNKEELWIYINGIATPLESAKGNCRKMRELFGQPVKLLHNPTDGPILDIMECMIGKTGLLKHGSTKPRVQLRNILLREMKNETYKKIVLVAHSQGTIITGNAVADISDAANNAIPEDDISWFDKDPIKAAKLKKTLKKFEVYLFAGCAHHVDGAFVHRLECLSNRGDLVAMLGHLFPDFLKPLWKNTWGNGIVYKRNKSYIEKSSWGHLLLAHYLGQFDEGLFSGSKLSKEYLVDSAKKKNA